MNIQNLQSKRRQTNDILYTKTGRGRSSLEKGDTNFIHQHMYSS
jgi:hypothetical protein